MVTIHKSVMGGTGVKLQERLETLRQATTESQTYLQKVLEVIPMVTERIQQGHLEQGFDELKQVFQGLIWLNNFLETAMDTLNLELDDIHVEGKSASEILGQLNKTVKHMLGATEIGDKTALGRIAIGSFRNSLQEFKSIFAHLNRAYLAN